LLRKPLVFQQHCQNPKKRATRNDLLDEEKTGFEFNRTLVDILKLEQFASVSIDLYHATILVAIQQFRFWMLRRRGPVVKTTRTVEHRH